MTVRFEVLDPDQIRALTPQLAAIERDITYPIADGADRFFIDHGADYGAFFAEMGIARFLVAFDGDEVVGVVAGAKKAFRDARGERGEAIYVGDLKFVPRYRGGGTSRRLFQTGLHLLATHPLARGWDFAYGAAMRGDRGDVRRSFKSPLHPGRLGRPFATLKLYFEPAERLRALTGSGPTLAAPGLDLSVDSSSGPLVVRNGGKKDFRLLSTGEPWRLVHLPRAPYAWGEGLGAMLRAAADEVAEDELACFALDERLTEARGYLDGQGLVSSAVATVIAMPHPWFGWRRFAGAEWIHLSTAEI